MAVAMNAQAQDTYLNERLTNTNDVLGTARFVGMGGAMGALGADISTMSWNPAGTGLYRKSDVAISFGGNWGVNKCEGLRSGAGALDQMGFLASFKTGSSDVPAINFGFSYQKKINFNHNYYADHANLGGLSQMDQVAELATAEYDTDNNLTGIAVDNGFLSEDNLGFYNDYSGQRAEYTHHSNGSLQGFDFNLSANINDRAFLGLTLTADNMKYRAWTNYYEESMNASTQNYGDYSLYNDYKIDGYGVGVKLGTIIRPIEESPFRFGFVVETPTWYRLRSSTLFDMTDEVDKSRTKQRESYLEYVVRTPWKVRASIGSTVGAKFAWDVDYEFAKVSGTTMGYPNWDAYDEYHSSFAKTNDEAMNQLTKDVMKGQHTLRAGMEIRPISSFAIRMGYNFISSPYKKDVYFDQFNLDSYAMNYATSTNYWRAGNTNILTLGLGYKYKKFYIDLAYKVRNQKTNCWAFDTSFTDPSGQFAQDYPDMAGKTIAPAEANLTRQSITCTLGFKF